jgi:exonuclease SbcD
VKVLHTSDWHLGRGLGNYDLFADQENAISFIVDEAIKRKVDVIVIAGDVFDRGTPPPISIRLLNAALTRLYEAGIVSIVTAGNHDSAERLTAYANLLKDNVYICGSIADSGKPIIHKDEFGEVAFYPLSFLWPDQSIETFESLGQGEIDRSHQAVHEHAMSLVLADLKTRETKRSVVIAHSFVTTYGVKKKRELIDGVEVENDVTVSESERDISIGGVQTVTADTFDGATYVALGHLHGAQKITAQKSKALLRYSGSPIRYSLSEKNHKKSFTVVNIGPEAIISESDIEVVPIPQSRGMVTVKASCAEILSGKYETNKNDFVELVITDQELDAIELAKARTYFPYVLRTETKFFNPGRLEEFAGVDTEKMSDLELISQFFEKVAGKKLNAGELKTVTAAFEDANKSLEAGK